MAAPHDDSTRFTDAERAAVRNWAFVDGLAIPLMDERDRPLGPRVLALTPDRLKLLTIYHSPISEGGLCSRARLIQALWILSAGFVMGSRLRFALFRLQWFLPSLSRRWRAQVRDSLQYWHRLQFIDRPPQERGSTVDADPPERWLASFVVTCMRRLSMDERAVRSTPYARLLQFLSELAERQQGGRPRFNRKRDLQAKRRLLSRRLAAGFSRS